MVEPAPAVQITITTDRTGHDRFLNIFLCLFIQVLVSIYSFLYLTCSHLTTNRSDSLTRHYDISLLVDYL